MRLVENWTKVLLQAWSVRFIALAILFTTLEVALPFFEGMLPVPTGVFGILSGLASAAAFVSRHVAQKSVSGDKQ